MSKEKQIEEMGKLCPFHEEGKCNLLEDEGVCDFDCDMCNYAEHLYNAGYRKQSEGRWEKIAFGNLVTTVRCGNCGEREDLAFYEKPYCPNCGAKMKGDKTNV